MTFLQQAAQRVFEAHGPSLRDVWVILPTRRAVSVFLDELSALSDQPFLAPHTLAVDDFITQAAGVQLIDSVSLVFELYEVFRAIDPAVEFEQFIGWASIVLADFDRIDQHRVDTHALFDYLTAAKALERWQVDVPNSNRPLTETPGTTRYFKLFENLQTAYHALHERLRSQGLAYRGMAYRWLADNVESLIRDNLAYERIYFAGFNALSAAEEHIIRVLVDARKAELIWDADLYYLNDSYQEAGEFLRKYRENGWFFSKQNHADLRDLSSNLTTTRKQIRVVGVPNASMQAKVAGKLYRDWEEADSDSRAADSRGGARSSGKTAIVLADETLLVPVLYALDERVTDLNVTMGLSLRSSLLFTLIDTLFEMQRTVHEFRTSDGRDLRIPKFHHRHVVKLLNHPFVRQYEQLLGLQWPGGTDDKGNVAPPEPLFQWMVKTIVKDQRVYMTGADIQELSQTGGGAADPLMQVLFSRWSTDHPEQAILSFYRLIDLLRDVYQHRQDAIEIEYLYLFFTLLRQLETTLERQAGTVGSTPITLRSFRQFLYELIRQTSIPFTSEGSSSLQVMGMLETRALDFDRVIILSVNEGVLPQPRRFNSLIPFDIATEKHIGLPTYREQESVMAYHFYRLLQRASDVVLLYTTSTDAYGGSKGEPSRFIRQIEHELAPKARGRIRISHPTVLFGAHERAPKQEVTGLHVPKTDSIRADLIKLLTTRGLYPSYLNQFVSCSMRFYFSRLVGISEEEDIEEKMGATDFGNWMHLVLESLDKEYRLKNRPVDEAIIVQLLEEKFAETMKGRVMESGINLLLYDLARKLMLDFQRRQSDLTGLTVVASEQTLDTYIDVPLNGRQLRVRIAGKIDRIEQYEGQIRIVDYKTGKVKLPPETPENLPDILLNDGQQDKMRQLWLYRYLALKNIRDYGGLPRNRDIADVYPTQGMTVEAGFYSFRDVAGGFRTNPVRFDRADDAGQYIQQSEDLLREIIQRMFDPNEPFRKTSHLETCQYCDFKGICGRGK